MSKVKKMKAVHDKTIDFEKDLMSKVSSGRITMKPRRYFVFGTILSVAGLAGLSVISVFFINIMVFLARRHGPMGQFKLEAMISSYPWWIPVLALLGIITGVWLLKRYDFSYRKNFFVVIIGFIASIIIAAFIIDQLGLNEIWARRGMMRKFYQRIENQEKVFPGGFNNGLMQNNRGFRYKKLHPGNP